MQEVFNWLLVNYRLVIDIAAIIIALILLIVKKKPVNALLEILMSKCLEAVLYVEHLPGIKGDEKLSAAVAFVSDEMLKLYPDIDITRYKKTIVSFIELILKTPQKKGEK